MFPPLPVGCSGNADSPENPPGIEGVGRADLSGPSGGPGGRLRISACIAPETFGGIFCATFGYGAPAGLLSPVSCIACASQAGMPSSLGDAGDCASSRHAPSTVCKAGAAPSGGTYPCTGPGVARSAPTHIQVPQRAQICAPASFINEQRGHCIGACLQKV